MRTRRGVDALFPEVRKRILATVLMQPQRSWYASELARRLKVSRTSLPRELVNLVHAGVLRRTGEGKQVYYQADPDCPFLPELIGLMAKTAGLVDVVREALAPAAKGIDFAFIYGSVARLQEIATSDIDVMIVGRVGLADLALPLRRARERLGREVSATTYSREEFVRKAGEGQHFLRSVLESPMLPVVGTRHDMEAALGRGAGGAARDQQGRAAGASLRRKTKPC
jgi:predicted nucleotidyltransferase